MGWAQERRAGPVWPEGHEASSVSFSQPEDGIRDTSVTGVQTCALPISGSATLPGDPDRAGPKKEVAASCLFNAVFAEKNPRGSARDAPRTLAPITSVKSAGAAAIAASAK